MHCGHPQNCCMRNKVTHTCSSTSSNFSTVAPAVLMLIREGTFLLESEKRGTVLAAKVWLCVGVCRIVSEVAQ
jgi:hypothetical protein